MANILPMNNNPVGQANANSMDKKGDSEALSYGSNLGVGSPFQMPRPQYRRNQWTDMANANKPMGMGGQFNASNYNGIGKPDYQTDFSGGQMNSPMSSGQFPPGSGDPRMRQVQQMPGNGRAQGYALPGGGGGLGVHGGLDVDPRGGLGGYGGQPAGFNAMGMRQVQQGPGMRPVQQGQAGGSGLMNMFYGNPSGLPGAGGGQFPDKGPGAPTGVPFGGRPGGPAGTPYGSWGPNGPGGMPGREDPSAPATPYGSWGPTNPGGMPGREDPSAPATPYGGNPGAPVGVPLGGIGSAGGQFPGGFKPGGGRMGGK